MLFASPWESMAAEAALDGLQFAQPIPMLQANAVFAAAAGPFQDLTQRLESLHHKIATQDVFLHPGVKGNMSTAINQFGVALLQLHKLTVFIRGDSGLQGGDDITSSRVDGLEQLQRETECALEQTRLEWENCRIQAEQCQRNVEATARQVEEASGAYRRANEETPVIEKEIGLLSLVMNDMNNGAKDAGAQAWDKENFAEGIPRLCQIALIDGRVCDEVETITNEISSGYSGQSVPDRVSDLLAKVGQAARDVAQKSIAG
ncbi:hypothetical protein FBEOM_3877 [Fusarium beomiforme]|uniref:Uncharacterized protein n=1 Tax=Fusarium beomiforme TaxID=44412 RepID=A0A9P5AP27_9HYPO|nr:hypothetical protein FBEOM_3877 [Fusarium beomiforme]